MKKSIFERNRIKIQIARKELQMDDDTYRLMLKNIANVESSTKLDVAGQYKVLHHLQNCGFKPKKFKGKPNNVAREPQLKKIEALLADMKLSWAYADAMAKHMFKVEKVAWLKANQFQGIITALVKKQKKLDLERFKND